MNTIDNKSTFTNLAADFPALMKQCVQSFSRTPERDLHILRRRYGLDGGPVNTLEELGACHDLTRERVRQVQARCVNRSRQMLEGNVKSRGMSAPIPLQHRFVALIEDLRVVGPCLSRSRFQSVVRDRCGRSVPGHWFELFAEVFGHRLLQPTKGVIVQGLKERWVESELLSQMTVNQVFKCLKDLQKRPEGVSLATMLNGMRTKGQVNLAESQLKGIVTACSRLEVTRGEVVCIRTEWLSSAADQAWRVLDAHRKSLSRGEVARRVNKVRVGKRDLEPMTVESVATRMSGDERFICCGKSGLWGLKEWGTVNDITIVEAMEKTLHAAGKPLSINAMIKSTLELRSDASPKSVSSYIQQRSDLFVLAARGRVALVSWGLKIASSKRKTAVRCNNDDFLTAVELTRDGRTSMLLLDLVKQVMDLTGVSTVTARQRLLQVEGLTIEDRPGRRGKVVHFADRICLKAGARSVTKRERIQKIVRTMIDEDGVGFERKQDLYENVNRQLPCERSTFYRYFNEMSDLSVIANNAD